MELQLVPWESYGTVQAINYVIKNLKCRENKIIDVLNYIIQSIAVLVTDLKWFKNCW